MRHPSRRTGAERCAGLPCRDRWPLAVAVVLLALSVPGSAQETPTPTATESFSPTATVTEVSGTPTDTATATGTPVESVTATPTDTAGETPTASPTPTITDTATETPTDTPTGTPTATPTETPTSTPTPIPTERLPRGCLSSTDPENIKCGELVSCSFAIAGANKSYRFSARTGDAACILTAPLAGSVIEPRFTLLDPDFETITACTTQSGGLACCDGLPLDGTYRIVVDDAGRDEVGGYTISLHGVGSTNRSEALNCAARVPCGVFHTAELTRPGDMDAYRVVAVRGDALTINTAPLAGSAIEPSWRLFRPNGARVRGCETIAGGLDHCPALPESGSYTLVVSDRGTDETGRYSLSVRTVTQRNCCAVPIRSGDSVEATIRERGQTDAFVFAAQAGGGVVVATSASAGSAMQPQWRVFAPDGTAVSGCSTATGGEKSCGNLPQSGTYTILVVESGSDAVGSYTIALQGDADAGTCVPFPSCAGDCDDDGEVHPSEIVRGVEIAFERAPVDACRGADGGGDGRVTIDDLVAAVGNALAGCP